MGNTNKKNKDVRRKRGEEKKQKRNRRW